MQPLNVLYVESVLFCAEHSLHSTKLHASALGITCSAHIVAVRLGSSHRCGYGGLRWVP